MISTKQLIESVVRDGGKLPADLIRDWISGKTVPGTVDAAGGSTIRITEDIGGDVEIPKIPPDINQVHPQQDVISTDITTMVFTVETAEEKATFNDMVNALRTAQIDCKLKNTDGNEWELTWSPEQDQAIENVLEGLGIEYEEDNTPEASMKYYGDGAGSETGTSLAIEAMTQGADPYDIIDAITEAGYKPKGWVGKMLKKDGKEFKTTDKYDTEPEAKRAIVAGLLKKIGKAKFQGGK